ncbi:M15 family metallopeptidase [Brachybacterium phenoliresistens]|uniref:Peptidase M15 n=1 Tax=Brachybacterium phenoliresistens TaxID=396014 RepID=Z9JXS5_9MICO|nr:M15 family metallopeptidase [Brachybacterium phenoliresistens]EWS82572.1 peptidase M15 [Brachybacterium phenoliresistens]
MTTRTGPAATPVPTPGARTAAAAPARTARSARTGRFARTGSSARRTLRPRIVSAVLLAIALLGAATFALTCLLALAPGGPSRSGLLPGDGGRAGVEDGAIRGEVSVFDEDVPAVAKLDPDLRAAVQEAARDAEEDGIVFVVNSGWRSPRYQEQLLEDAIAEHGSREEAARWVATPETSSHVSGEAIDIGSYDAAQWLMDHGERYDLCQTYENETWHYELRLGASRDGCPAPYRDPTQDPRLQVG